MVRIRLQRVGAKKQPYYRVVVTKKEAGPSGKPIENIGNYNPRTEPITFTIKEERALYWLSVGAQPSEAVLRLLKKGGIWDKFQATKAGQSPKAEESVEVPVKEEELKADEEE